MTHPVRRWCDGCSRSVLFTAADAFLRDYTLQVPHDCTTTVVQSDHEPALRLMQKRLAVDARVSDEIDFRCPPAR